MMENEKRLIYLEDALVAMPALEMCTRALRNLPTVDAVEVTRIEEVKQEIIAIMDEFIAEYRRISESYVDHFGGKADAMEVARRLVNAALTDLCSNRGDLAEGENNE